MKTQVSLGSFVLSFAVGGCINRDVTLHELVLVGEVGVAAGLPAAGQLQIELHHAESGAGMFVHPLGLIADFPDAGVPGTALDLDALVPIDAGTGLLIYAWLDVDGDGVLCAPGVDDEPAGLARIDGFPAHALEFSLVLDTPCVGPEALYP